MKENKSKIAITCASCGKTRLLRADRVSLQDYYLCMSCYKTDSYKHPPEPEGSIRIIDFFAADGFVGFTTRLPTWEEKKLIERANAIREARTKRLKS